MQYREGVKLDSSRVRTGGGGGMSLGGRGGLGGGMRRRRAPRRGGVAMGGGLGGILLLVLVLLFGGNLGSMLGTGSPQADAPVGRQAKECENLDASQLQEEKYRECRWVAYDNALHRFWQERVDGFSDPQTSLFSGRVQTACGTGSTEMGPFYCPGDHTIYIDSPFVAKLFKQLGAKGGDAAELYVYAHEYGHHISNITGDMRKGRAGGNQTGPKSGGVRLELQADCYAGVFMANTANDPKSPIESISRDDLLRVADAARAVGDDHIQERSGGRVVPESWTHGSSEMRQRWVARGFDTGDPLTCDTFSTDDL